MPAAISWNAMNRPTSKAEGDIAEILADLLPDCYQIKIIRPGAAAHASIAPPHRRIASMASMAATTPRLRHDRVTVAPRRKAIRPR